MAVCIECGKEFDVAAVRRKLSREYYKGVYDDQYPDANVCYDCALPDISASWGQEKTKSKTWAPVGTLTKKARVFVRPFLLRSYPFGVRLFSSMILKLLIHFSINAMGSRITAAISSAFFPASYKRRARPMRRINFERFNSSVIFICETSLNSDFSIKHHAEYADKTKRLCCLHGLFIFFSSLFVTLSAENG